MTDTLSPLDLSKTPRISIFSIIVPPGRGRKDFSKLEDLYQSIKKLGVIQPIVVERHPTDTTKVVLVAGECRLRCKTRGVVSGEIPDPTIPYFWNNDALDEITRKEIELDENLHRNELAWEERVELMRQAHELKTSKYGKATGGLTPNPAAWSLEKTAAMGGVSKAQASVEIKMANLLKSRPDLRQRLTKLPMVAAAKEAERILGSEKAQRLHESGQVILSANYKLGDTRELLKAISSDSIDLWLTDMPFGNQTIGEREGESGSSTESYLARLKPTDNLTMVESKTLIGAVIPEVFRVLKPGSHFYLFFGFEMYETLLSLLRASGFELLPDPLIWDKGRVMSPPRGYEYGPCYEPIFYGRKPPRDKRRLSSSVRKVLEFKPLSTNSKIHPFQKPGDLLDFLIKQSTNQGDTVLDTFAASGSTLVAARLAGRSAIGHEIDSESYFKGQKWLSETKV